MRLQLLLALTGNLSFIFASSLRTTSGRMTGASHRGQRVVTRDPFTPNSASVCPMGNSTGCEGYTWIEGYAASGPAVSFMAGLNPWNCTALCNDFSWCTNFNWKPDLNRCELRDSDNEGPLQISLDSPAWYFTKSTPPVVGILIGLQCSKVELCNEDLEFECVGGLCSSVDNVLGVECSQHQICASDLSCEDDVCKDLNVPPGGACSDNLICAEGLTCTEDVCKELDIYFLGECSDFKLCGAGLYCHVEFSQCFLGYAKPRGCPKKASEIDQNPVISDLAAVRCCNDDGSCTSKDSADRCYPNVNREDAELICSDTTLYPAGGRLCTSKELADSRCCQSGCGLNSQPTWVYDNFPPNTFAAHEICNGGGTEQVSYAAVRCCKDNEGCISEIGVDAKCYEGVPKQDAIDICEDIGYRLCTESELPSCCGTGCKFGQKYIWSA